MLNGWQWLVMLALPPLVVMLYFLKLRRLPVEVPSTYLWRRTIEDLHVNSIWQRLRKNLLLLLQLLVLLFLILACLRPGIRGTDGLGGRAILLIDNSCSMQATDVERNRLAVAKSEALEIVSKMAPNDVGMVIAFSDKADVKQGFTADQKKLRSAIESIVATNRTTDLSEALRAASGLANPGRTSQIEDLNDIQVAEAKPAKLFVFSDGGFGIPQMDLGNLAAEYFSIGSQSPSNVAILAFTAERNPEKGDQIEAFARIQNFGVQPASMTASLYLDDELVDATAVSIEAESNTGVSFELGAIEQAKLRLEIDIDDDLAFDNVAFAGLDPPRQLEVVLVTRGNTALEAAFATAPAQAIASIRLADPAELETEELTQLAASGSIDLFIYDACSPSELPEANTLFLGGLPPGEAWSAGAAEGPTFIIDTNRAHPLMQYVDMGTVRIVEAAALQTPAGATELLRSDTGVLMAVAPREAYQDAVLAMPFMRESDGEVAPNTDWPIKRSFPVFALNALEFLGGAVSTSGSKTMQPGQPAVLNLASRFDRVLLEQPDGKSVSVERAGQPSVVFGDTEQSGFYETRTTDEKRLLQLFTVNLFSERESDILPRPEVTIGATDVVANSEDVRSVRVEYWRWLLALALVILSVEWVLYNRRVAV